MRKAQSLQPRPRTIEPRSRKAATPPARTPPRKRKLRQNRPPNRKPTLALTKLAQGYFRPRAVTVSGMEREPFASLHSHAHCRCGLSSLSWAYMIAVKQRNPHDVGDPDSVSRIRQH